MVGYLYPLPEERRRGRLWGRGRPHVEPVRVHTLHLLGAGLPPGELSRQLDRGAKALRKKGCVRALTAPELEGEELSEALRRNGLAPIDPLPLCRAKAPQLALALVEQLPLRRRCVALRGEDARAVWPAAAALCPQVGMLLLDFGRGEEELACRLREVYGAAALDLRQGPTPQASVEFDPCGEAAGTPLRLWGSPGLAGRKLAGAGEEYLPLLELLWETGRLGLEDIVVR